MNAGNLRWIKEENRSGGLWMERKYEDLFMEPETDHKLVASLQMQGGTLKVAKRKGR